MKKIMYFLFMALVSFSCENEVDDEPLVGRPPSSDFYVLMFDQQENNMLDPGYDGPFDLDKVQIYKTKDGKESVQSGISHEYFYIDVGGKVLDSISCANLSTSPYEDYADNLETMIIRWNETETDTIVCEVDPEYYNEVKRIYLNGELAYPKEKTFWTDYIMFDRPFVRIMK